MATQTVSWQVAHVSWGDDFEPIPALNQWWDAITPTHPFRATTTDDVPAWTAEIRRAVEARLGWTPPPAALAPRILDRGTLEPGVSYRFGEVETSAGLMVPFMLLIPEAVTAPAPAVLCVHGHGDGMNPLFGLDEKGHPVTGEYQHAFALEACRRGFVALTFDMLCFGRRRDFAYLERFPIGACVTPSELAVQLGASMLGLRVFDARQMLTLLGQQPEVDAERLGIAGISGGGAVAFFTTFLDDRVKAAMISGFFNRFSAFMQVHHCVDNFVPGLSTVAEMPDMGCAIAPRPLLISQGTRDPIFPIDATRAGVAQVRQAYRLFDADDRLEEEYYDANHVFSNARVWDFMQQWL